MKSLSLFFGVVLIMTTNLFSSFRSPKKIPTESTIYTSQRDSVAKILKDRNVKAERDFSKFSDSLYHVVILKKEKLKRLNRTYLIIKDTL